MASTLRTTHDTAKKASEREKKLKEQQRIKLSRIGCSWPCRLSSCGPLRLTKSGLTATYSARGDHYQALFGGDDNAILLSDAFLIVSDLSLPTLKSPTWWWQKWIREGVKKVVNDHSSSVGEVYSDTNSSSNLEHSRTFYFEISVLSTGKQGGVGIGLAAVPADEIRMTGFCFKANWRKKMPGWSKHSLGLHSDGEIYDGRTPGKALSHGEGIKDRSFRSGDIVGVGWDVLDNTVFFTKNGILLTLLSGNQHSLDHTKPHVYRPVIGLDTAGASITANFGANHPFLYDLVKLHELPEIEQSSMIGPLKKGFSPTNSNEILEAVKEQKSTETTPPTMGDTDSDQTGNISNPIETNKSQSMPSKIFKQVYEATRQRTVLWKSSGQIKRCRIDQPVEETLQTAWNYVALLDSSDSIVGQSKAKIEDLMTEARNAKKELSQIRLERQKHLNLKMDTEQMERLSLAEDELSYAIDSLTYIVNRGTYKMQRAKTAGSAEDHDLQSFGEGDGTIILDSKALDNVTDKHNRLHSAGDVLFRKRRTRDVKGSFSIELGQYMRPNRLRGVQYLLRSVRIGTEEEKIISVRALRELVMNANSSVEEKVTAREILTSGGLASVMYMYTESEQEIEAFIAEDDDFDSFDRSFFVMGLSSNNGSNSLSSSLKNIVANPGELEHAASMAYCLAIEAARTILAFSHSSSSVDLLPHFAREAEGVNRALLFLFHHCVDVLEDKFMESSGLFDLQKRIKRQRLVSKWKDLNIPVSDKKVERHQSLMDLQAIAHATVYFSFPMEDTSKEKETMESSSSHTSSSSKSPLLSPIGHGDELLVLSQKNVESQNIDLLSQCTVELIILLCNVFAHCMKKEDYRNEDGKLVATPTNDDPLFPTVEQDAELSNKFDAIVMTSRKLSAVALANVSRSLAHQSFLLDSDVISCIVMFLTSGDVELMHRGSEVLCYICEDPAEFYSRYVDRILRSSRGQSWKSVNDEELMIQRGIINVQIVKERALKSLVRLVNRHNLDRLMSKTKFYISKSLHGLSLRRHSCKALIEHNGIKALVRLASAAFGQETLWGFTDEQSGEQAYHRRNSSLKKTFSDSHLQTRQIRLQRQYSDGTSQPLMYHMCGCFFHIASIGSQARQHLIEGGALLALVATLASFSEMADVTQLTQGITLLALKTIGCISLNLANRRAIFQAGLLSPLFKCLTSSSLRIRQAAIYIIANLTEELWLQQNISDTTTHKNEGSSARVVEEEKIFDLSDAANVARSEEIRIDMMKNGGVSCIIDLIEDILQTRQTRKSPKKQMSFPLIEPMLNDIRMMYSSEVLMANIIYHATRSLAGLAETTGKSDVMTSIELGRSLPESGRSDSSLTDSLNQDELNIDNAPTPTLVRFGSAISDQPHIAKLMLCILSLPFTKIRIQGCRAIAALISSTRQKKWQACRDLTKMIIDNGFTILVGYLKELQNEEEQVYMKGKSNDDSKSNPDFGRLRRYIGHILNCCGFLNGIGDMVFCRYDASLMRTWWIIDKFISFQRNEVDAAVARSYESAFGYPCPNVLKHRAKGPYDDFEKLVCNLAPHHGVPHTLNPEDSPTSSSPRYHHQMDTTPGLLTGCSKEIRRSLRYCNPCLLIRRLFFMPYLRQFCGFAVSDSLPPLRPHTIVMPSERYNSFPYSRILQRIVSQGMGGKGDVGSYGRLETNDVTSRNIWVLSFVDSDFYDGFSSSFIDALNKIPTLHALNFISTMDHMKVKKGNTWKSSTTVTNENILDNGDDFSSSEKKPIKSVEKKKVKEIEIMRVIIDAPCWIKWMTFDNVVTAQDIAILVTLLPSKVSQFDLSALAIRNSSLQFGDLKDLLQIIIPISRRSRNHHRRSTHVPRMKRTLTTGTSIEPREIKHWQRTKSAPHNVIATNLPRKRILEFEKDKIPGSPMSTSSGKSEVSHSSGASLPRTSPKGNATNRLQWLDLSGNCLGDAGAASTLKIVLQNSHLRGLDLSRNGIREGTEFLQVCRMFDASKSRSQTKCNLDSLHLADNGLTSSFLKVFFEFMRPAGGIDDDEEEEVETISLEDVSMIQLSLSTFQTLNFIVLNISGNAFGDDKNACEELINFVTLSPTLRDLDLSRCSLSEEVGKDLRFAVEHNETIHWLRMHGNPKMRNQDRLVIRKKLIKTRKEWMSLNLQKQTRLQAAREQERLGSKKQKGKTAGELNLSSSQDSGGMFPESNNIDNGVSPRRRGSGSRQSNSIGILHSCPLAYYDASFSRFLPIPSLDHDVEKELLAQTFREANRNLNLEFRYATTENLRSLVTLGTRVIHFSGHGYQNGSLAFEKPNGECHFVQPEVLRDLCASGPRQGSQKKVLLNMDEKPSPKALGKKESVVQLAFVAACHSHKAGQAFIDAGVPHVVCVRMGERILDRAAHFFTHQFYLSLAVGNTVQEAFHTGQKMVAAAPWNDSPDDFRANFLLLPKASDHEERIFSPDDINVPYITRGEKKKNPGGFMPNKPQDFLGRNVEMLNVIIDILRRRLITITGPSGIGKTALATASCLYLLERNAPEISEGSYFVRLDGVSTLEELLDAVIDTLSPRAPSIDSSSSLSGTATSLPKRSIATERDNNNSHGKKKILHRRSQSGRELWRSMSMNNALRAMNDTDIQELKYSSNRSRNRAEYKIRKVLELLEKRRILIVLDHADDVTKDDMQYILGRLLDTKYAKFLITRHQRVGSIKTGFPEANLELKGLHPKPAAKLFLRLSAYTGYRSRVNHGALGRVTGDNIRAHNQFASLNGHPGDIMNFAYNQTEQEYLRFVQEAIRFDELY
eukprot:g3601.t1